MGYHFEPTVTRQLHSPSVIWLALVLHVTCLSTSISCSNNGAGPGTPERASGGASADAAASHGGGRAAALAGMGGLDEEFGPVELRFVGRFDMTDPQASYFGWPGSSISARFYGTAVNVRLDDPGNYFGVLVDGEFMPEKLRPDGNGVYTLASGLAEGAHHVTLWRLTEPFGGESRFLGFEFPDGHLLPRLPDAERRVEVIGDSITAGYGNDGPDQHCGFSFDTENHYLTYGAIAARELGADLVTIAWSGKGVFSNRGKYDEPMPEIYTRARPLIPHSDWDFSAWQPHAVVVNLGTNDFADPARKNDPNFDFQDRFTIAYLDFLQRLRQYYPEALLVAAVGPMLKDEKLALAREYVTSVVQEMNTAGDPNVVYLEFQPQEASSGYGCDWHPSITTHRLVADSLVAELRSQLNW